MKKLVASILALVLLLGVFAVGAAAVAGTPNSPEEVEELIVQYGARELVFTRHTVGVSIALAPGITVFALSVEISGEYVINIDPDHLYWWGLYGSEFELMAQGEDSGLTLRLEQGRRYYLIVNNSAANGLSISWLYPGPWQNFAAWVYSNWFAFPFRPLLAVVHLLYSWGILSSTFRPA